ncbi:MAG: hypothetical protein ACE15C_16405 [Phycisphaerae bacterium]
MADTLAKVKPGDPLAIQAGTFNTFVDAANDFLRRQHGQAQSGTPVARQAGIILVKNGSGADRARFDVLGVDSPLFDPADDLDAFKNQVALVGVTPTEADHFGKVVILLEPVVAGEIGLAVAVGVCPVMLDVTAESDGYADVNDGDCGSLKTGTKGSATILWKVSGTGSQWGVVKLAGHVAGTHNNPKVLGGSGDTADTEEWDVDDQEAGNDGVKFSAMRLYWSGTSGDPVYQFIRTPTYDSIGRLVHVSAEVRSTAFGTGNCGGA